MGAHQDRFFEPRTARAAPPSPPPKKDTSHNALYWARGTSAVQSAAVGFGLFMGLWPENPANASIAHLALPFIAPPLLAGGLGFLWHHTLGICAHDAPLRKHVIALCLGVAFTAIGIGCSGSNLAGLLGGENALRTHQERSIETLRQEVEAAKNNAAIEAPLLASVEQGGQTLWISANSENNRSVIRKTKPGMGTTYTSVSDAAENAEKVAATMRQQSAERDRLLKAAETALGEARRASEASDADQFEDAYGRAATAVSSADKVHLSSTASALGLGLALDRASAPFVNGTLADIDKVRQNVNAIRRPVAVSNYQRISERDAVRKYPGAAFLPWLIAVLTESLALMFMPLLLTLWRSEDDDPGPPSTGDWLPSFMPTRPQGPQPLREAAE
jgi:hypothetical protein